MKGTTMTDDDKKVKASTGLTEREENQLPNWAQERISDFRDTVSRLRQENNGLKEQGSTRPEKSKVAYGDVENDPSYLPDGSFEAVRYSIGDGHVDVRLKDVGGGVLELAGSNDLSFAPQATNVIRIGLKD